MKTTTAILVGTVALGLAAYGFTRPPQTKTPPSKTIKLAPTKNKAKSDQRERAIVAGGCFWGTEKYFRMTPGITATASGYIGGKIKNPTYEQVCDGITGCSEGVMVEFDPAIITYAQVLDRFWQIHNPCTLNSQGPDFGDQYRSGIYPMNEAQLKIAEQSKRNAAPLFKRPIVTEIVKGSPFYMAEDYHQQYTEKTGRQCAIDFSDHVKRPGGS
jgi:methionine-S-sulfoxide reductase